MKEEITKYKWSSNHIEILADVDESDLAPIIRDIRDKDLGSSEAGMEHTLGLVWDTKSGSMYMKSPVFTHNEITVLTKPQVASINHQFFDPLKWWVPLFVRLKLCSSQIVQQVSE